LYKDDRGWTAALIRKKVGINRDRVPRQNPPYRRTSWFRCRVKQQTGWADNYRREGKECEIITLNSLQERMGIASALVEAVKRMALDQGCKRLLTITTNDNVNALRSYQKVGFEMVKVRRNALERSRKLKPEIPLIGKNGIPLKDEIELELILRQ
jgi:GNAT superfamily N-acetyltransferase